MDNSTLIVLPSARAIRHEQLLIESQTLFLPNFITMGEFISRLCLVNSYSALDDDTRVLLLLEASDFQSFSELKIERNFFTFTKNASYIFKFFEELSAEMYDIDNLKNSDVYGEFEEHIDVLEKLYENYEKLCNENKLLDKIFLPKLYQFNKAYIQNFQTIEIKVDGYLTRFELKILQECTKYCEVFLLLETSKFNLKMQNTMKSLGFQLLPFHRYKLNLNNSKIVDISELQSNAVIESRGFSESLLQVGFVKEKIYEFIQKGYSPEKIAVVLADESFAKKLKLFDEKSNFNFAMGEPYTETPLYKKLKASYELLDQSSKENHARLERLGRDFYEQFIELLYKGEESTQLIKLLDQYQEQSTQKTHRKIFNEELYKFQMLLPFMNGMGMKSLLSLFLQRLSQRTLDDVRGGKITVMGVLETRSVSFDGVILVDFSDANVPKRSSKDMFLNSHLRELAQLPTLNDRENLQKHYYYMLIQRSKEVAISYIESQQSSASYFLHQLGIGANYKYQELDYAKILFAKSKTKALPQKEIIQDYSFKNVKLSASRLKTYLMCKRKYYYRYIEKISNHEIPRDMPKEHEIGIDIHQALKNLYTKKNSYESVDALHKDLSKELDFVCGKTELDHYLMEIQKKSLEKFCKLEVERFISGWEVEACEINLECNFAGTTLIGQIDRIDKKNNQLYVLDYKTGSYDLSNKNNFSQAIDFQLEFYYLLGSKLGEVVDCGFYDLKNIKIEQEKFLQEKLAVLEMKIKELLELTSVNFELCEDVSHCMYCEYKLLCDRK